MTLKRSSIIHHVYIAKNVTEIALILLYLPLNISYGLETFDRDAQCELSIQRFPGIGNVKQSNSEISR